MLNALYKTNIYAIRAVAQHIRALQVDESLAAQDLAIVEKIARVEFNGKRRRNYSFATKYCAWHRPELYPIYDRNVDYLLWGYHCQEQFADFDRRDMWSDYAAFVRIYDAFRSHFSLEAYSYRQIDKFLWRYGRQG
ncbi:MAG: hypothetical protein HC802_20745 [Caldilineaceae bacterium]|nr:hypothetical protein [Caldilineaceae bacterium]